LESLTTITRELEAKKMPIPVVPQRIPAIYRLLAERGIDITQGGSGREPTLSGVDR
jgi:hypothetical protein